jgi:mRNA interferase RelE/StbE
LPFQIQLTKGAQKELRRLPRNVLERVDRAILALADDPRPHGARKLTGSENTYRVRVGSYRILYEVEDQAVLVLVVRIRDRKNAYD